MMVMELRAGEGEGGEERGGERRGGGTFWLAFGFFWGGGGREVFGNCWWGLKSVFKKKTRR